MSWCDEILGTDPSVEADYHRHRELLPRAAALPTDAIARGWRIAATTPFRDHSPGETVFRVAPRDLAETDPVRALDLVLAIVEHERDDRLVAFLAHDAFFAEVLRRLDRDMLPRLERAALRWPRLRLLLGLMGDTVRSRTLPAELRGRLDRLKTAGREFPWREEPEVPAEKIARYAALEPAAYARRWAEMMGRSPLDKALDDECEALVQAHHAVREQDPCKLVAVAAAIARLETSDNLLSYLVAGLLDDALPIAEGPALDALIAEIDASFAFADLVSATMFGTLPAPIPDRIESALRARLARGEPD